MTIYKEQTQLLKQRMDQSNEEKSAKKLFKPYDSCLRYIHLRNRNQVFEDTNHIDTLRNPAEYSGNYWYGIIDGIYKVEIW